MQEVQVPQGLQHPQHPGFVAKDRAYDCTACIRWHGQQYQFADLEPENFEAWELYNRFQSQVRVGMDIVGLDATPLDFLFRAYEIHPDEYRTMLEKLFIIDGEARAHRAKQAEMERRKRELQQQK